MIRNKNNFRFIVEDNGVHIIDLQKDSYCMSFNVYGAASRYKFKKFKNEILKSKKYKYDSINDIYGLATKYEIRGSKLQTMTIHKNVAF